jgi:hypothetical protein
LEDLRGLFKEIYSAVGSFKLLPQFEAQWNKDVDLHLKALSATLKELCLDVDATKDGGSSRWAFLQIAHSSVEMERSFKQVNTALAGWDNYFPPDALKTVQDEGDKLVTLSRSVQKRAERAAASCDTKEMHRLLRTLRKKMTTIQITYEAFTCHFGFLQCLPEVEPPFIIDIQTELDQAGVHVASVSRTLSTLCVSEEGWVQKLAKSWQVMQTHIESLKTEIAYWEQRQLCAPTNICREILTQLQQDTQIALGHIATLQRDPDSREARDQQLTLVERVQATLVTLSSQASHLSDNNFNKSVFAKFGWPIAQIRQLLSTPEEKEEPYVLTKRQWRKVVEGLKTIFTVAGGMPYDAYLSSSIPTPPHALAARVVLPDGAREKYTPFYLETWKKAEELTATLKSLVSMLLKPRLEEVISEIQREQRRLQPEVVASTTPITPSPSQVVRRWNAVYTSLTTACATTRNNASNAEKKQLAELDAQLLILHQHMQETLGSKLTSSALTTPASVGVAL